MFKVASAFRFASAAALRRAALYALRLSLEAYMPTSTSKTAAANAAARAQLNRGPVDSLFHIVDTIDEDFSTDGFAGGRETDAAAMSIMDQPVIVDCVDWAATTWKEDPDEISRALKHEIVQMAVSGMS